MGKILRKGERGAAKAYVTRSAAVKKLQCTLADFRRLCILKGIFPREPKHRKKANKGNSVATSFYYAKDIAYLAHEPVLMKLREHKAFAKKLSRALGRGEWSSAKSLDEHKPTYKLDHIVKERYPTFIDALRDIDDALCLVTLFASLPSSPRTPATIIESCTRLTAEWQLYVMHTRSLRKVFLSIKGVYFQAEVAGQTITWLVPYMFTQAIPTDVDIRVMLTFLELYQTLLGFVFFKLYTDAELVYPPPLDLSKDASASGVDAYRLQAAAEAEAEAAAAATATQNVDSEGKPIKGRDVRRTIKEISGTALPAQAQLANPSPAELSNDPPSIDSLSLDPTSAPATPPSSSIFSSYTFYLAPGSSRPLLEFTIRSFGGRVGWPASMGSGSPIKEDDESITHVIIDRPLPTSSSSSASSLNTLHRERRKFVQPQWVVDSINAQRALPEGPYAQGATLPPHLSPFGEEYEHIEALDTTANGGDAIDVDDEDDEEAEVAVEAEDAPVVAATASAAAALEAGDTAALRVAELAAERAGVSTEDFDARVGKATRKAAPIKTVEDPKKSEKEELEMTKMMMSNKQRKLFERMRHSQGKKNAERELLESKRVALQKSKAKELRRAVRSAVVTK